MKIDSRAPYENRMGGFEQRPVRHVPGLLRRARERTLWRMRRDTASSFHRVIYRDGMQFDPDDEDRFFEFRDELVDRFESTVKGAGLGWVAGPVLDFKFGYLDGDIGRWTGEDILGILLELYPRKVMVDPDDVEDIIAVSPLSSASSETSRSSRRKKASGWGRGWRR